MPSWVLVIVLLLVQSAVAQELPSEMEVRAVYCLAIVHHLHRTMDPPSDLPAPVKEAMEKARRKLAADLRSLGRYLQPRLSHLDPLALASAQRRGIEDVERMQAHAKMCAAQCLHPPHKFPPPSCLEQCNADNPGNAALQGCADLRWLPH